MDVFILDSSNFVHASLLNLTGYKVIAKNT